jgi:nitrogen fixation protein NifU and related proteins
MTDDLRDLYQEMILEHSRSPRNRRAMPETEHRAVGYNPLCGDQITVYVEVEGERIADVSFEGHGCAISTASASILTEMLKGKSLPEAEAIFTRFHDLVTGRPADRATPSNLGKLAVFGGVSEFPARVKCATLAWHTFRAALEEESEREGPVTTE